jgi:uncharacterized DUF497 family protein
MLFERDEGKRRANLAKRLIDFQDATQIFDRPVFEKVQRRHGEERAFAIGLMGGVEIVVVYVMRGERRRIIRPGGHIEMKGKTTQTTSRAAAKGATHF